MSDAVWSRLADAFPADAVAWVPVEVDDAGEEVRVVPRLAPESLRARFDEAAGVAGWSVAYAALDGGAIACHLSVAGATKGAVAPPALVGGAAATAAAALAAAAELCGARPPFAPGASAWVACDPETRLPLHPPDLAPERPGAPAVRRPDVATPEAPAAASATAAPASAPTHADAAPPVEKPAGQQMIDRLVERLKLEGQGLAAARLLVRYGGYGKDPDAARELYAQLRALLRAAPVAAGGRPDAGAA